MKKIFSICLVLVMFNFFSCRALASGKKGKKDNKKFMLFTPALLLRAVERGEVALVEQILNSGISKKENFVNYIADAEERPYTPLTVAIKKLNDNMVIMLLQYGANPNEVLTLRLKKDGVEIDKRTPYQILKNNINNPKNNRKTLLQIKYLLGRIEKYCGDNNITLIDVVGDGNSASASGGGENGYRLVSACDGNQSSAVSILLMGKSDPNSTNERGETALFVAAKRGCLEIVKLLLDYQADPNTVITNADGTENSALKVAFENDHSSIGMFLSGKV